MRNDHLSTQCMCRIRFSARAWLVGNIVRKTISSSENNKCSHGLHPLTIGLHQLIWTYCKKHVSKARKHPIITVGCNYLSLPVIHASDTQVVLICYKFNGSYWGGLYLCYYMEKFDCFIFLYITFWSTIISMSGSHMRDLARSCVTRRRLYFY